MTARLIRLDWPDFGTPDLPPPFALDEARGRLAALRGAMAGQFDVIPSHPVFGSTRMEDGYVIADAALRAELAARFPAVAARCAARADFMRDTIGMDVPETLLPLADTCGIIAPFLLDARQVIALRSARGAARR